MNNESKFLTVGEIAKKMNVSVRTIQYYDQIGLLSPSAYTEGKRRLYSMKDYVILHQIVNLKELGFSLNEIKERLMPANNVEQIDKYLKSQEEIINEEIKKLKANYEVISKFRKEMNKMKKLDWELFVEILSMLRNKDEYYWIVKYFDKNIYNRMKEKYSKEKGDKFISNMIDLTEKALVLKVEEFSVDSDEGYSLAKQWWDEIMRFSNGDMDVIKEMTKLEKEDMESINNEFMKKYKKVEDFISKALLNYFEKNNIDFSINGGGEEDNDRS